METNQNRRTVNVQVEGGNPQSKSRGEGLLGEQYRPCLMCQGIFNQTYTRLCVDFVGVIETFFLCERS